jgi:hypothetical protein
MTIARTIGLGLGLVLLVGIGAATWSRAQQVGEKNAPRAMTRAELRERVITLQTEVDLLQVDFDGARATLVEWVGGFEKADLMGIDMSAVLGTVKMDFAGISGDVESLKEMSDRYAKLEGDDAKQSAAAQKAIVTKQKEALKKNLDRKKQEFANLSRHLSEKKLDLAEAEKQYQSEAR